MIRHIVLIGNEPMEEASALWLYQAYHICLLITSTKKKKKMLSSVCFVSGWQIKEIWEPARGGWTQAWD